MVRTQRVSQQSQIIIAVINITFRNDLIANEAPVSTGATEWNGRVSYEFDDNAYNINNSVYEEFMLVGY